MKRVIVSILAVLLGLSSLLNPVSIANADRTFEPDKFLMCNIYATKESKALYKAAKTEWLPYLIASKSTTSEQEDMANNVYNSILKIAGYSVGKENPSNPFEQFGLSGLTFVSYTGEWKYYDVDPCETGDRQVPKSTNYGEFYEGRLDPLSTYEEQYSTKDVRTKEFARGRMSALYKAIKDNTANLFLGVAKTIVTLMLALLSMSLTDLSSLIGLDTSTQASLFKLLYTNIFLPFITVTGLLSAVYMMYKGLFKGAYREALVNGLGKTFLSLFIAVILSVNPSFIAIPNKVSVAAQSLIIAGLTENIKGDGTSSLCTDRVDSSDLDVRKENFLDSSASYMKNVIGCRIWSEFLFKPYVMGQFGTPYEDLTSLGNENEKWVGKPVVSYNGTNIENWGLFHVSVMSGAHEPLDGEKTYLVGGISKDYYRIVDALSNYDEDVIKGTGFSEDGGAVTSSSGGSQQEWIARVSELAKEVADESGLYASVMIAQAALESGYGNHLSASYNYFGIKCSSGHPCGAPVSTQEEVNGSHITIRTGFRAFSSEEDGFRGYARFLHGEGAGANFSGAFKKNASTPEEAVRNLIKAGYATDSSYVAKIMAIINTYNLTQYDTENKEGTNLDAYRNKNTDLAPGDSISNSSFAGDGPQYDIPIPKDNPPLKEWDTWIGNQGGTRFANAFMMVLFSIVGSMAPLYYSLLSSAYSIAITLLMIFAPVFLLIGTWGGRGNNVLVKYLGSIISLFIKRLGATFLLVLSIIVVTNALELFNKVGAFKAILFLLLAVYLLIKQRATILAKLSRINIDRFTEEPAGQSFNKAKDLVTDAGMLATAPIVGGIVAKRSGGSFTEGATNAFVQTAKDKMYKTTWGRRANAVYQSVNKNSEDGEYMAGRSCVQCGEIVTEGQVVYVDENGNIFCEVCSAAKGYKGLRAVTVDNERDEEYRETRGDQQVYMNQVNQDGTTVTFKPISYLDRKELVKDLQVHSGSTIQDWNQNSEQIKSRIRDSLSILANDMGEATKVGKTMTRVYIPEPLRGIIDERRVTALMKEGKYEDAYHLVTDGWTEWYKTRGDSYKQQALSKHNLQENVEEWNSNKQSDIDSIREYGEKAFAYSTRRNEE